VPAPGPGTFPAMSQPTEDPPSEDQDPVEPDTSAAVEANPKDWAPVEPASSGAELDQERGDEAGR
jgi:hypothetical protein